MPLALLNTIFAEPAAVEVVLTDQKGNTPASYILVTVYAGATTRTMPLLTQAAAAALELNQSQTYTLAFSNTSVPIAPVTFNLGTTSMTVVVPGLNLVATTATGDGTGYTDFLMDATGDFVPNWQGGFTIGSGVVIDYQDVNFRVQLNDPELRDHAIGANLEDLNGKPNLPSTAQQGEAGILRSLSIDGRFSPSAITTTAVPLALDQLGFFIALSSASQLQTSAPLVTAVANL